MTARQEGTQTTAARVLLVDDQPDVRLAFRYMLEADGYRVIEAGNGTEALAQLVKQPIDVIVTDLYMPWMDGLSLLRAVRSNNVKTRVIAMSGSPNLGKEASLQAASILGADAVLEKPVTRLQLVGTIKALLNE
jgi:CheY-like chemotaxis protein